ncbi:MAG TPA: sugar phosphate nucleotidyltransferase [Puia sp.]|nr:sugar phosphate nucleotidyltransferase [Puia sp.]
MNSVVKSPVQITRAMILAAGLGTRFSPWTDRHPKALAPVNGRSLLERNIKYLKQYGITEVVINVHHFARQIVDALEANDGWGCRWAISDETSAVLETGGGLKKARPLLEGAPFVLMNVDILTDMDLLEMIEDHFRHRPLATLAVTDRVTSRYFLFDVRDELCGWRNAATGEERMAREAETGNEGTPRGAGGRAGGEASGLSRGEASGRGGVVQKAFSGIHVIDPAIFGLMTREGKFSMVDLYLDLAGEHPIRGFDHSRSRLIDVGKPESVQRAEALFP